MGGTQSVKRFASIAIRRHSLAGGLFVAVMHTCTPEISLLSTIQSNNIDDLLAGPEDISVDEIDAEFDALEKPNVVERFRDVDIDGLEILEGNGNVYNFDELARVEAGMVPKYIDEEFSAIDHGARAAAAAALGGGEGGWDVASLMSTYGFL